MMRFARKNIVEPFHGFFSGSPKLRYWKLLEKTQYYQIDQLFNIQWGRLNELLSFAWEHNQFYRKRFEIAGIRPTDIRKPEDMMRLSILSKDDIRKNSSEMISRGFSTDNLLKVKTGGSTGKSLELYLTEECSELRNACARRHDCWTGWKPGEPIAACWGNPHLPKNVKQKFG